MARDGRGRRSDERMAGAGTTVRFVQMMVLMVVATAGLATIAEVPTAADGNWFACAMAAGINPEQLTSVHITTAYNAQESVLFACFERERAVPAWREWLVLIWPMCFAAVALTLSKAIPTWKTRRRGRLRRLEDPAVLTALRGLIGEARLDREPAFYIARSKFTPNAVTFGSDRRPVVRLNQGLVWCRRRDPDRFRAVVLHEFAHIRNRDVTLTYATIAMWWSFALTVALPYTVFELASLPPRLQSVLRDLNIQSTILQLALAAITLALVHVARQEVLRSREMHADRTARAWGADLRSLGLGKASESRPLRRAVRALGGLLHAHPSYRERRKALNDDAELFTVRASLVLVTGVAAAIVAEQAAMAFGELPYFDRAPNVYAGLAAAALVAGVVGIAVWRAVAHAVRSAARPPSGARVGLLLGTGLVTGEVLRGNINELQLLSPHPEILLVLFGAGVAFGWWTATCAGLWVGVLRGRSAAAAMVLVLASGWIAMAAVLAWWQVTGWAWANGLHFDTDAVAQTLASGHEGPGGLLLAVSGTVLPFLASFVDRPLMLIGAVMLWLVPLLPWALRPGAAPLQARSEGSPPETEPPPLRVLLRAALIGSAACLAAVVAGMAALHGTATEASSTAALAALTALALLSVVTGAAIAATVAAVQAARRRVAVALIAANLALIVSLPGVLGLYLTDGCVGALTVVSPGCGAFPADVSLTVFKLIALPTIVLAAAVAVTAAAVVAAVARIRKTGVTVTSARRSGGPFGRVCVVALCATAFGFTLTGEALNLRPLLDERETGWSAAVAAVLPESGEPSAHIRALQLSSWMEVGGSDLFDRFSTVFNDLNADLGGLTGIGDEAGDRMRAHCEELRVIVADAEAFFDIPDPRTQQSWAWSLRALDGAADACVNGVDQSNAALNEVAIQRLTEGVGTMTAVLALMEGSMNAGGP